MRPWRRPLLAGLAWLALACQAAEPIILRTAAQEGSQPKFIALPGDPSGAVGGLCVDIMRAIERADPQLRFSGDQQWAPLLRVETEVAVGKLDAMCGLIRTSAREATLRYIDTPLFPVEYRLVVRADDPIHIDNWDDIRRLGPAGVILSLHGYGGVQAHLKQVGGLRVDAGSSGVKSNLEKLLAGRGRFFIHRSPGIRGEIARSGLQDKVRLLPTVLHREVFYLVVGRQVPPAVVQRLNQALLHVHGNGEMAAIVAKWDE